MSRNLSASYPMGYETSGPLWSPRTQLDEPPRDYRMPPKSATGHCHGLSRMGGSALLAHVHGGTPFDVFLRVAQHFAGDGATSPLPTIRILSMLERGLPSVHSK